MGSDRLMNISGWNAMAWGNLGATLFLAFTRIAYLSGFFSPDRHGSASITAQKKSNQGQGATSRSSPIIFARH
ncbi:hypothetical protein V8C42DRAFT_315372, partial [Trichoderma barbatum]